MTYEELTQHSFTKAVFEAVRPIMKTKSELSERHGRDAEYVPDESEFYLMRVGNRLATLLSHCEQLSHAILFMSTYRETPSTVRAGITRAKHLRYGIESYVVRTQTLYDLVLRLVDAVFHLTNADSQCRHATIVHNLKVKRTGVPKALQRLEKRLTEFRDVRHTIVHRAEYQDEDLYRIELLSALQEDYVRSGEEIPGHLSNMPEMGREMIRELIRKRKDQYTRFNSSAFQLVSDVLASLQEHFAAEERRVGG